MTVFVDLETAQAARGLRLVVVAGIPSPWSEAAKGIFRVKRVPFVAVRLAGVDKAVRQWTRARNAPAAMYDDEPARTGWADILELAERLAPSPSLVPASPSDRVRMFGLAHELMGEGGLLWACRLLTIHAGLITDGARGFPPMIAQYLGPRYGYTKATADQALTRIEEGWRLLRDALGDRPHFFDQLSALDIYAASAVNIFDLPAEDRCPMLPPIRAAFESMKAELPPPPPELLALRARMYEQHLEMPMAL